MGEVKWAVIKIGDIRIYSLAYADDMILMADEEDEMRSMMERLERLLEERKVELNTEKTKIIRFRRRRGREKKKEWR